MKTLGQSISIFVLITTLLSVNTWAQETDLSSTWFCIDDDSNGIQWKNDKWTPSINIGNTAMFTKA